MLIEFANRATVATQISDDPDGGAQDSIWALLFADPDNGQEIARCFGNSAVAGSLHTASTGGEWCMGIEHGAIFLLSGWAVLHRRSDDGRRRIADILLPGSVYLNTAGQAGAATIVAPLTELTFLAISAERLSALAAANAKLAEDVSRTMLRRESRMMNATPPTPFHDHRDGAARQRLAFELTVLWRKLSHAGLVRNNCFRMEISRHDFFAYCGLSADFGAHVLQELEDANLLIWRDREIVIPDVSALAAAAVSEARSAEEAMAAVAKLEEWQPFPLHA